MRTTTMIIFLILCFSSFVTLAQEAQGPPKLEGRWDLVINWAGKKVPGWLEVRHSGISNLVGRIMLVNGSARPISKINFVEEKFSFSIPPQWDKSDLNVQMAGVMSGDSLRGSLQHVDGKTYSWVGGRAPSLKREKAPEWAAPITLFNGKDTQGWHTEGANQWIAEGNVLRSPQVWFESYFR